MKLTKINIFIGVLAILSLNSCNDINDFNPLSNITKLNYDETSSSLKNISDEAIEFKFDPASGGKYTFKDNSQIEFEANSFYYQGKPISCTSVKVKVIKILNKKEMLKNSISTNSNNQILESGGMFYTAVSCDEKELELAPGKKYILRIQQGNTPTSPQMEMFYGEKTSTGINWIEADNNPNTQNNVFRGEWKLDSNKYSNGIICFPERLHWVNCDFFNKFTGIDKTEPCLIADIAPTGDVINIFSYCVFKNYNSIIAPCCSTNSNICFSPLPIGEEVTYILYGIGKNKLYLGHVSKKVEKSEITTIKCEIMTEEEIKKFFLSL